jgi:hypothetical protein
MSKAKAKQKALELIEKMNVRESQYATAGYTMTEYQRIQCSIVLVNELIDVCNDYELLFWCMVEEELEKM